MNEAWKRMSSGKYVDLNNLQVSDISFEDINTALNLMCRFNGHHKESEPLTVAQHTRLCLLIADRLFPSDPIVHMATLVHDWPEYLYGDIATPVKRALGKPLQDFTDRIDRVVMNAVWPVGWEFTHETKQAVKICDLLSLDIERRSMWKSQYGKDKWPDVPGGLDLSVGLKNNLFNIVKEAPFNLIHKYEDILSGDF